MSLGIGDALREERESQGRSQQDVAGSMLVRTDYIAALEDENFSIFGADTYARGHLRTYAVTLGMDPAPLLATYDRYVRTEDQTAHHMADAPVAVTTREPLPKWVTVLGAAVVALVAIGLVGTLGNRTPDPATPSIADDTEPTEDQTDDSSETPGTFSPSPSATPTFDGVELLMVVEADCWMSISVDGQPHPRSDQVIRAGETLTISASETVQVRYGNAGGVIVEVNGTSYGRPGGNGAVVEVTYGPDGPIEDEPGA